MNSLDPKVLLLGITCAGFFVGWLLGRKVESLEDAFDSLAGALVAMGALCMASVFFYMAWQETGAKARLARENLPVSVALGHAVGAQGGRAPRYVWRFEALDEPSRIIAEYDQAAVAAGWNIERHRNGILLKRSDGDIAIWTETHDDRDQIVVEKRPPGAVRR